MNRPFAAPTVVDAFRFAFQGLLTTLRLERNMKVHWVCGLAVQLVAMALPLPVASRCALLLAVGLVVAFELTNASIEATVDLVVSHYDERAKVAKDAAAAAVLVVSLAAALVLATVLVHQWSLVASSLDAVVRTSTLGLPCLLGLGLGLFSTNARLRALGLAMSLVSFTPLIYFSHDLIASLLGMTQIALAAASRSERWSPKTLDDEDRAPCA